MSKKYIIALAALLLIAASGIAVWFVMKNAGREDPTAEIIQDGKVLKTVPLSENTEFIIECDNGYNTVTIKDGTVMISAADCPDLVCVKTGAISGGAVPIVCLPHRLEIRVVNGEGVDARI
ncbi:MAG: NusG domain II-containing protein [Oscillospiraceae bacterium]|nr:NusG domain II-containing protein [Oscillospiraceae bacterium]